MDHWHDRFDFPELETDDLQNDTQNNPGVIEEKGFLTKFKPKLCSKYGYVHMFPAFYKSCIKFDMLEYPKDWIEKNMLPVVYVIRKILVLVEMVGLIVYYIFHLKYEGAPVFTIKFFADVIVILAGFIIINKLNLQIYEVMRCGWMDMQSKLQGIR